MARPVVLIVEDHPGFRRIYQGLLSAAGYETVEAEEGASGLELARLLHPDLILLDLLMPGLDGFAVLERLRRDPLVNQVKVLVFSAMGEADDIARARRLGADDYSVKCQDSSSEVLAKISGLLAQRTMPRPAVRTVS